MAQTVMNSAPDVAFEGMLQSTAHQSLIDTFAASGSIYFGKGVSIYAATEVDPGNQRVKLPAAAGDLAMTNFFGVAIADPSKPATANAYGEYVDTDAVPVLRKGRVWVVSADAVDSLAKGVYCRNANGAAAPADTFGSFRATVDADYTVLASGVRWIKGKTIGSVYFGLLELNLVS